MYRTEDGLPDEIGCERLLRAICRKKCHTILCGMDCECYSDADFVPQIGRELAAFLGAA